MIGRDGVINDQRFESNPFYQLLREKERLLREYKYKYETTKLLYEEMINSMMDRKPIISTPRQLADIIQDILETFMKEISPLNLKTKQIQTISSSLQGKFSEILSSYGYSNGMEVQEDDNSGDLSKGSSVLELRRDNNTQNSQEEEYQEEKESLNDSKNRLQTSNFQNINNLFDAVRKSQSHSSQQDQLVESSLELRERENLNPFFQLNNDDLVAF